MPEEQKEQKKEKKKRVYPKRINEPKTCDEILDIIKNFFAKGTSEMNWDECHTYMKQRDNLWSYLTALRGPDFYGKDDTSYTDKTAYTSVLRSRIISGFSRIGADVKDDTQEDAEYRSKMTYADHPNGNHFYVHAHEAFKAIGWNTFKVNPPKKEEEKTTDDKSKE